MRLTFTLVLILLLTVNLHAAEQQQKPGGSDDIPAEQAAFDLEHLTLDDAITSALEHSPKIKEVLSKIFWIAGLISFLMD